MRLAAAGDTIRVHYKCTLANGKEFDSSAARAPIDVTLGNGRLISGFEDALVGMSAGDTKRVALAPNQAYGLRDPHLVHVVARDRVPAGIDLYVGKVFYTANANGTRLRLLVVGLKADDVTLDANHPLAGKWLNLDLTLIEFVS